MPFDNEVALILAMLGMSMGFLILLWGERARRRKVEARLAEADARSHSAIESMVHAVITLTAEGTIIECNGAALELFDEEEADLIGRNVGDLVVSDDGGQPLLTYLQSLPEDSREWGREVLTRRKDGSQLPSRMSVGAYRVGDTRLFTITLLDLARTSVIQDLRASEKQLRQITDAVPALIAYVDGERCFRFHNRAYEDCFGLKPEQVQGRTMREVFGDELYEEMRPRVDQVLVGSAVRFERAQVNVQGELRHYAEHYFPRYSHDDKEGHVIGFHSLATDITELKRIDRMKSEFISIVSHELRTPLTSIRGSLGLIAGGMAGKLPEAAKSLVDIAKNNCERLVRLINDILDTEKIESGTMTFNLKVVDIGPLVAQSIAANEGFAVEHEVTFNLHAGADAARVTIDSDCLSQVLTNLLSNAVKFSPAGGSVEVGVTRENARVRVEVRDHGPGIPEEFRARIFQKFSQADSSSTRQKGGTGLGLNISKAIVERLGGTIGFATEIGAGTTFFFEFPEWRATPAIAAQSVAHRPIRPCILVCEDDPDIGRLIGMMLGNAGYDTDLAFSAAQARELAAAKPYAAMTVDLKLPDQDGIALIRSLREAALTRGLPIVVVSANAEKGRVQINSETLSVSDWLGKPIDANRLVGAIRDAVTGRVQGRPRILHVEDDPDVRHISAAIARDFATFEFAATLQEARACLLVSKYDLVLLDLNLPEGEGSGWDLLADIDALDPPPPVVVFSAGDVSHAESERVAAVLVKAQTSNEKFLETIERVLARGAHASARREPAAEMEVRL